MLYIAYLPKPKGEHVDQRKIHKILKWYTKLTGDKYSIIAAPGYLSKTTETVDEFLEKLKGVLANNFSRKIGLLHGMNGNQIISGCLNTIYNDHIQKLGKYNFNAITLHPKATLDHRKMMCFFHEKDTSYSEITLKNLDGFVKSIHVGAMLIGSSNQSNTSYFEKLASKGEADIFLIDASDDKDVQRILHALEEGEQVDQQELLADDNIVITKSFFGRGDHQTQEFLKDILKELLRNSLQK